MITINQGHWGEIQRIISDDERYRLIQQYFADNPERVGENRDYIEQVNQQRVSIRELLGRDPQRLAEYFKINQEIEQNNKK
mgnify:FL=1